MSRNPVARSYLDRGDARLAVGLDSLTSSWNTPMKQVQRVIWTADPSSLCMRSVQETKASIWGGESGQVQREVTGDERWEMGLG